MVIPITVDNGLRKGARSADSGGGFPRISLGIGVQDVQCPTAVVLLAIVVGERSHGGEKKVAKWMSTGVCQERLNSLRRDSSQLTQVVCFVIVVYNSDQA